LQREIRGEVIWVETALPGRIAGAARAVAGGLPLRYAEYASPAIGAALADLLSRRWVDIVHFDHLHMAQLVPIARAIQPWAHRVVDAHNVEATVAERVAKSRAWPAGSLARVHAARVRRLEMALVQQMDAVIACSGTDAAELARMGARAVHVVPNSTPVPAPVAARERRDVVFVGSLDWWPNADAAIRLAREIWPLCRGELGGSRLVIVGRNPPAMVRRLAGDGVVVTGSVDSVQPYLASAWATAMPIRAGSGTRIKILEAWSSRVPVVATALAAEGLPYRDGANLLVAETPAEFATALRRLHADEALRLRLREAGACTVAAFDPAAIKERVVKLYREWASAVREPTATSYTDPAYVPAIA
jgi:polysaccharide biosynthesis protein PslH